MTNASGEARKDAPSNDTDPGDRHSGEGLASVRPRLARTLADSDRRNQDKQMEAMTVRTSMEPAPVSEAPDQRSS